MTFARLERLSWLTPAASTPPVMRFFWLFCVFVIALSFGCASRHKTAESIPASAETKIDASTLVPAELTFARPFVQLLLNSGWTVQPVRPSKLNGFFRATNKAAWIDTDRGIFEVIFFDNDADVDHIQITTVSDAPTYHKYLLKTPTETRAIEGSATYFTKHRNMLIVTIDTRLNDSINRMFASSTSEHA